MRFSHALIIALALQIEGCEAGLFDWLADLWNNHIKPFFVSAWERISSYAKTFWNAVKSAANKIYEWIKEKLQELREWSETNWDCGADNFWPSKVFAKLTALLFCSSIYEKINDACKRHDSCYSKKIETRTTCDLIFCDELFDIRIKYSKEGSDCSAPDFFCVAVIYAGHTA